ncbi:macrophage mannose receptor 1-like [Hoplias malabaricus]|uniref:macrophage mannose receptor 1-like n=1 Tax=Hoplias malabaricus TaxID=27720 RepID=UPI0034626FA6
MEVRNMAHSDSMSPASPGMQSKLCRMSELKIFLTGSSAKRSQQHLKHTFRPARVVTFHVPRANFSNRGLERQGPPTPTTTRSTMHQTRITTSPTGGGPMLLLLAEPMSESPPTRCSPRSPSPRPGSRRIYSAPVGVFGITMATTLTFLLLLLLLLLSDQSRLRTFHLTEKRMNQSEARAACRTNYTDLVTVYSEEDNATLSDLVKNSTEPPWIGLYRSQPRAKWSNGDDVTFSDLTGDCGTGPCCAAVKADGSWESLKCTVNRTFMCYKQDATDLPFSYTLVLKSLNWYEAQSHCRKFYTGLVSIRDQTQNEEVKKEGESSSVPFWIGLLRDDWEWSDGGRSAYRNWGNDQPRASSNCTYLRDGKWYSVSCTNNQFAPCYRTHIHVSAEPMNWESALDYCKKENRKSVLHIESDLDQKEVERELRRRGVSGTLWLGLGQSRLFGFWIWTNGISVGPFSNWVGGRAPEAPLSQNCGAIDTEKGFKWRDRDCRSKYRVLCEEH